MHLEVLTERGRALFSQLNQVKGFYLAGGTALALQIGHRQSFDFDLFSSEEISASLLPRVKKVLGSLAATTTVNNADELTLLADGVKITFLFYPFPVLSEFVLYEGVSLLSVARRARNLLLEYSSSCHSATFGAR